MYALSEVDGVVRVEPKRFGDNLSEAIADQLETNYIGQVDNELGRIIKIISIIKVGEGIIVPGDGAAFYKVIFTAIHFKPEVNEIVEGEIRDIAKFGAFIDFGPFEGMVHVSQTMDDFVSVSKEGVLQGKDSKKVLKKGDKVRARIVAVSIKDTDEPKIGLTMRQEYLGKIEWIAEQIKKEKKDAAKIAKATKTKK
ncbi:DNA-directed RNA polymerase [Candidatus Woesearchaeota archaeon]|jgi:DNA-directed RNA polymerase subunit E'|nr:DNA-directed RNA polymerase [Candidatus Woesearchaeota archaeon]MBT4114087.1 DNA-directed RNA polymerase [Candidatus Woesearchaeota archaeon]MBT4248554.1 DNA-directed RNA polymerase [Candidatus Woesearchaeota archaeon]